MNHELLTWMDDPAENRGIRFAAGGDEWDFHSYARLADRARRLAAGLTAAGVSRGDVVVLVARTGPELVAALFGCVVAGATPCLVAPPMAFQRRDGYPEHVAAICADTRPSLLLTDRELVDRLAPIPGLPTVLPIDEVDGTPGVSPAPTDLALVQFTSGSNGTPRGVRVPHTALAANIAAIRGWLAMTSDDPTASWLPLHHDMGLVGCLLTPVTTGADLWLLRPEDFIRDPRRYLRCLGARGARLSAMPTFGLAHIVRRVRPSQLVGMDFSAWRALIVGAERVDPVVLEEFHTLLGVGREVLLPAYGLAEATLAVTGLPPAGGWRTADGPDGPVVGCGRPLKGVMVSIVDDRGPLPEGVAGEIAVAAGSLPAGGVLRTGDVGFLRDGELFVLGRMNDSVKVRGRSLFAEDMESVLTGLGLPAERLAAALGEHDGRPAVLAVVESAPDDLLDRAPQALRARSEGAAVVVVSAPRGTIPRTSSGKPQRRRLWQAFRAGDLRGSVVAGPCQ
jgi:acyl-CoA synthetase (AMP-forming)/AMP-acid ligase II